MKKTLLIAAATLAAGVISSQAQVYSQNIVGYYNVTVPAKGFALVGNQLNLDGTNAIGSLFGAGLVSDPNLANNTELLLWNPATQQYQTLLYVNSADATTDGLTTGAGWYDGNGTFYNPSLQPGTGAFLYNYNNNTPLTVTLVGTVPQTTNVYTIGQGYNLFSLAAPVVTNLVSSLGNFSGVSDPNLSANDQVLFWNPATQQYQNLLYVNSADAATDGLTTGAGFYDGNGTFYPAAPSVGQAFFIYHQANSTETWTNSFSF